MPTHLTPPSEPLLTAKELALALRRKGAWYVYRMKRDGFIMPGGLATLSDARAWLEKRPSPCRDRK